MDVQVQVAGQITSGPTRTGGQKFDIPLSNGMKPSTFDVALATKVSQFGGAVFTARLEQKGKYWNLIDAAGPGESLSPEIPQAGTPIGQTFPAAAPVGGATPIVPASSGGGGMSAEDKTRITKLAVLATATQLVSALFHGAGIEAYEEAVGTVEGLAKRLYTQARSHEPGAVPEQVAAAAEPVVGADPQSVAAFVAEQAGTPVVQVGVAGVSPAAEPATLPWS